MTTIAEIRYDPDAKEGHQFSIALTELAVYFMSNLTDEQLKIFAAEASIAVRKAFEMPPSPTRMAS